MTGDARSWSVDPERKAWALDQIARSAAEIDTRICGVARTDTVVFDTIKVQTSSGTGTVCRLVRVIGQIMLEIRLDVSGPEHDILVYRSRGDFREIKR